MTQEKKEYGHSAFDLITIYRTKEKQWRWRRVAANGEVVGASSEGYHNFNDCRDNLNRQFEKVGGLYSVEIEE